MFLIFCFLNLEIGLWAELQNFLGQLYCIHERVYSVATETNKQTGVYTAQKGISDILLME